MIVFVVDINPKIGAGHFMRCLALAQAAKKQRIDCVFICAENNIQFAEKMLQAEFLLAAYPLPKTERQAGDNLHKVLAKYLAKSAHNFVFLDGYHYAADFKQRLQQSCKQLAATLVQIDDNADCPPYLADYIVNPSVNSQTVPDYSNWLAMDKIIAGDEFRLLRQEFAEQSLVAANKRQGVVITMGGTDPLELTWLVVKACEKSLEKPQPITVVIGQNYPHAEQLKTQINQLPEHINYVYAPENMAALFASAKFVISAAGSAQFELFSMQTPAILLVVADNQVRNTEVAKKQGWVELLDCRDGLPDDELVWLINNMCNGDWLVKYQRILDLQQGLSKPIAKGAENVLVRLCS
ncbi:spore coat polysaccharide biosynthesis protein glycosyltransferase-like protein [Catenovulum agarivorans DS-2]|uniref:Spore coat polysaccharide biosynthesis protein glycosyltransferase-like protein n=1 Tax=Catenovulum agarivorans DS-2 TaxID=1328313 RepID=W7QNI1_9ALTE|nr:UDP-2,4-diacetamido-2,4,6-trideoxy-beta-L-altropyranose hydrolase [Catenovulum agarivorans]EWH09473.1 spore coat polysaccharide biosynthesis protein glycosyltransferase-like protein [Catenovulum agarivorans DS-2]